MSLRARALLLGAILLVALFFASRSTGVFGKQYEYEEDLTLSLDGTATLVVNTSLPALATLRGLQLDTSPRARVDAELIRSAYKSPVSEVTRVSRPWTRSGRRFVQVRVAVTDVRRLHEVAPLSWSRYSLAEHEGRVAFTQHVGASAFRPGTLQKTGWNGSELVAFRLHLPSRILDHNSRDIVKDEGASVERGNILRWEQRMADRLDGVPVDVRVVMDRQSILYRTLWLFAGAFLAAVGVLAAIIWWTMRRGVDDIATTAP
jgi:hypothetical protein